MIVERSEYANSGNLSKTELLRRSAALANLATATERVHLVQVRNAELLVAMLEPLADSLMKSVEEAKNSLCELRSLRRDLDACTAAPLQTSHDLVPVNILSSEQ